VSGQAARLWTLSPPIPRRSTQGLDYDPARAAVNGTVTLLLPRVLELAINDANYHLPAHISASIPSYRLREVSAVCVWYGVRWAQLQLLDGIGPPSGWRPKAVRSTLLP
jgi:hypothetical protein